MSLCDTMRIAFSTLREAVIDTISYVHALGIISTNYGSLVATLSAAGILFFVREFSNKATTFSGVFYVKTTVKETARNPYRGMNLYYTLVVYSDGNIVSGTSEKTGEICSAHSMEYIGEKRTRGAITGVVERNYFRSSVMNIHIAEQRSGREYTTYMSIKVRRFGSVRRLYSGRFYSTAANSKGSIVCGRIEFKDHPTGFLQSQSTSESS